VNGDVPVERLVEVTGEVDDRGCAAAIGHQRQACRQQAAANEIAHHRKIHSYTLASGA